MKRAVQIALLFLGLGFSVPALAQSAPAQQQAMTQSQSNGAARKPVAAAPSLQPAQNNFLADGSQPTSLGDLARLARAKKKDEPKAAKVIDDESMPRGGIPIGGSAPDSSSSSSQSGEKLVLLDFWASWCGPCRESLPDLKRFQSAFSGDQVQVVSISEDRDENTWNSFVSQNQMTWEQRFDNNGESARRYGVQGFPTYILMDSKGTILQRYQGEDPSQSLVERIGPDVKKAQDSKSAPAS
ncbi:MAG: TlpA disulfide reductase family protein [Candidatus Acidiferrales bacterium]